MEEWSLWDTLTEGDLSTGVGQGGGICVPTTLLVVVDHLGQRSGKRSPSVLKSDGQRAFRCFPGYRLFAIIRNTSRSERRTSAGGGTKYPSLS